MEAAIVVERRAPEHRAVVHHAVIDVAHDFAVAKAAGLLRDAQIAGIHEADEFRRFVIEPDIGIRRIGGGLPELRVPRQNVRLLFRQAARGIAAVAIGAAEHDMLGLVHRLDALMALQAADAFGIGFAPAFDRSSFAAAKLRVRSSMSQRERRLAGRSRKSETSSATESYTENEQGHERYDHMNRDSRIEVRPSI